MTKSRLLPFVAAASMLTGCGTLMHGSRQNIYVESSTPGAMVETSPATGSHTAPTMLNLERKNSYVLTFSAPGYNSSTVAISNGIGVGTVIADAFLGFVGIIVDAVTGSWYGLSPETASATLSKKVGMVGPDQINIQLTQGKVGQVEMTADGPGVSVEVTKQ